MIQRKDSRSKRVLLIALMMVGLFVLISCTASQQQRVYHGVVMKGSIVQITDDSVYLCIGSKDGAMVGQELDVYKVTFSGRTKSEAPSFKREKIGKLKIVEIIDEHFAKATIIVGKAGINDVVELAN